MDGLTPLHLILVLGIALLVIGPGKLPETGEALGRALREFRHAMNGPEPASATEPPSAIVPAPTLPSSTPPSSTASSQAVAASSAPPSDPTATPPTG